MAGVTLFDTRTADQLRLLAHLRWRIFVNSLRTRRGKADLVARIVSGFFIGTAALGLGVLLGFGSWAAFHQSIPLLFTAELWVVFLVWQLLPVFITGFGAQADLGSLLRFPFRYSTYVVLTLAYGVADPVGIASLYWLAMILAGIALSAPAALLWAIPTLLFFALVNLLVSRSVFAWLDRWLAKRRTREILALGFFLLMMSFQFIGPLTRRLDKRSLPALARIEPVQRVFPPGLAAYAIGTGYAARSAPAFTALAGLAATAVLFSWLLGVRLRAQYRGENLSEETREAGAGEAAAHRTWQLAGLPPAVAALFEKDLRYLLRNTTQYMTLAVPLILVAVFSLNGVNHAEHRIFSGAAFFPMSVAYCLLVLSPFVFNSLGYDGAGVAMLFAAPVRFRDVLLSKNLLHAVIALIEILLVATLAIFLAGFPPPLTLVVTLAGAVFVVLVSFAAGNMISLYFPRRQQFGTMRRQNQPGVASLVGILVPATAIGIVAGAYGFCMWVGSPQWALFAVIGLLAAAFVVYRRVLTASSTIAEGKRDVLMEELCKTQ